MSPHFFFFFFNDTATTEIYTLSLHDALPISMRQAHADGWFIVFDTLTLADDRLEAFYDNPNALRESVKRSEERFSRNAETDLVCRLLLEKKKNNSDRRLLYLDVAVQLNCGDN